MYITSISSIHMVGIDSSALELDTSPFDHIYRPMLPRDERRAWANDYTGYRGRRRIETYPEVCPTRCFPFRLKPTVLTTHLGSAQRNGEKRAKNRFSRATTLLPTAHQLTDSNSIILLSPLSTLRIHNQTGISVNLPRKHHSHETCPQTSPRRCT
jgi:hypothetical protein